MACRETREAIGPRERVEYHAFPLAAGYCFDVRVSVVTEPGADPFPRAAFVGLIDTFRVALLRRGWRGDYPDAVLTIMNEVAFRTPGWHEWLVEEARARPDDYALPFVRAEMLEVFGGSAEKTLAAYARTIALLGDLEERTPAQHFIWAVCEDGAGLTLAKNGRVEEAIAHYRAGYQVAADLGHIVRAPLAYNLACAAALSGDRTLALSHHGCARLRLRRSPRRRRVPAHRQRRELTPASPPSPRLPQVAASLIALPPARRGAARLPSRRRR
jgi:hypothetical protein